MKRELELLQRQSTQAMLDENERQALRESLLSYMERNPIRPNVPMPVVSRFRIFGGMNAVLVGLLVVILCGGGIAYAAQGSIPGDSLYSFKRNVNEKVLGFFAFSDASKAELDVTLADERLQEAEKLHNESKLDSATQAQLSADLNSHVARYHSDVSVLTSHNNNQEAEHVESKFESSLHAHAGIVPLLMAEDNETNAVLFATTTGTSTASTTIVKAKIEIDHTDQGDNAEVSSETESSVHSESKSENGSQASSNIKSVISSKSHSTVEVDVR